MMLPELLKLRESYLRAIAASACQFYIGDQATV